MRTALERLTQSLNDQEKLLPSKSTNSSNLNNGKDKCRGVKIRRAILQTRPFMLTKGFTSTNFKRGSFQQKKLLIIK